MNDRQLDNKVRQDIARVNKDLNTLVEHSAARVSRFGGNVSQATGKAKDDLSTWVGDGVSQLSDGFEKLTDDVRDVVVDAAAMVKKDVGHGLSQYNAEVQKVADRAPGGIGKKAAKYPWVTISITLIVGLLLGNLLKPAAQPL
jgi:ElaB/YqjD/DUF883 family membrane-anchored ribosome-binding protein